MKAVVRVDTTKFTQMCRELGKLTGAEYQNAVEYEVGRIIEKTIANTPAAHIDKIRAAQESATFTAQPDTLYTPRTAAGLAARGKAHRTSKRKLLTYWLANRYPNDLWQAILEARKQTLARKISARGFAKWTWASIAAKLGIGIRIPGYIVAAGGVVRGDPVSAHKQGGGGKVGIWIENASTVVQSPHVKGRAALTKAIAGRVSYFRTNLRKKVFESMATIAKRYPGIETNVPK